MVRLRFDTDLGNSLKVTNDLTKAVDALGDKYEMSAREAKALEKAAERIAASNLNPQEKYNRKVDEYAKLVKSGKLAIEDAEKSLDRYRKRADDAARSQDSLFGPDGIARIGLLAGGIEGARAAVQLLTQSFKEAGEEAKRAGDRVFDSLATVGELQQLDPAGFANNLQRTRGLIRTGVFRPDQLGEASKLVFAMESAGYSDQEKDFIGEMGRRKFVEPQGLMGMAESLRKLQRTFGDKDAGTLFEVTDKVIQASKTAQASVPETMKALLEVAPSGTQLGMTDEQVGAAFLAVEAQSPNSEIAATKTKSLFDAINKRQLWKGNLPATIADIERQRAKGKNIFDVLGESRAVEGFTNISQQLPFMEQQRQLLESAPRRSLFENQSHLLDTDPTLHAARLRTEAVGDAEARYSSIVAERQNLMDMVRARRFGKAPSGNMWIEQKIFDAFDATEQDNLMLRNYGINSGLTGGNSLLPEERAAISEYLKRIADSNERMERATSGAAPPRPSGRQE